MSPMRNKVSESTYVKELLTVNDTDQASGSKGKKKKNLLFKLLLFLIEEFFLPSTGKFQNLLQQYHNCDWREILFLWK